MIRTLWFPLVVLLIVCLWIESRFRKGLDGVSNVPMPAEVDGEESRRLYSIPAGRYTAEDIKTNGHRTAGQAYREFESRHDVKPRPGDSICPITRTKAHPRCTWTVNGRVYRFCCPPCIDEFVRLAKDQPEQIKEPGEYIQK